MSDPHFQRGFVLLSPTPGKKVPGGKLQPATDLDAPVWELAQWSSKHPLDPAAAIQPGDDIVRWQNPAKSISLAPPGNAAADLILAVNASAEYGERARKSGKPWVHLLVEQKFFNPPAVANLATARLHIETRLRHSRLAATNDFTPTLHAAQFQLFLTIQNLRSNSTGYGKYLWFGVPLYDSRYRIPVAHKSPDTGGTDMFIFTPGGEAYTTQSAHDLQWLTVDTDLLPLTREALATAWQRGFLTESKAASDYYLTCMNLGWEVPGIYDVEMQVRNLSLLAMPK